MLWLLLLGVVGLVVYERAHQAQAQIADPRLVIVNGVQHLTPTVKATTSNYLATAALADHGFIEPPNFRFSQRGVSAFILSDGSSGDTTASLFILGHTASGSAILAHLSGPYIAAVPLDELALWAGVGRPWAVYG